jgi:hypothetical protein
MSSTTEQLEAMKQKWNDVIALIVQASAHEIAIQNNQNKELTAANPTKKKVPTQNDNSNSNKPTTKSIKVGGQIDAGSAKIYSYAGDKKGQKQYYSKDPRYTVIQEKDGYLLVRHHSLKSGYTGWFKKSDVRGLAVGTKSVDKSGLFNVDELGEELILRPQNGRLTYLEKGSGVIPADLTSNLMQWGELDPQDMLDRNRPKVETIYTVNNEINIDNSIAELIHIDNCSTETLPDVEKIVNKALDQHMKNLNNSLKRFTR